MSEKSSKLEKLENINVLIMDADHRVADLVRRVLYTLNFRNISYAKNGAEGFRIMDKQEIDLVITDWDMKPLSGLDFIKHIRQSDDSPNRTLPIIMLTAKTKKHHVLQARDAGMTEFLIKPFSAKTICDRITLTVEHPRNFIVSPEFTGPDRRRHEAKVGSQERRKPIPKKAKLPPKMALKVKSGKTEQSVIFDADYSLHEKIGKDISMASLFTPEVIADAQKIIKSSENEFMKFIKEDLSALETQFTLIATNPKHADHDIQMLSSIAMRIKSRAGIFDYSLASHIAESMYDLVSTHSNICARRIQALRIHIDALYVIFHEDIKEMGGKKGKEIVGMLSRLSDKMEYA